MSSKPLLNLTTFENLSKQSSIEENSTFKKALTLLWMWGVATVVCLVVIMLFYTYALGRNRVELNETIYEGHLFVGQSGAFQLNNGEGYGLTTYGENGMIVNKVLKPDVFRILFLGDSFVKARQVSDPEKFTELVEKQWNVAHPKQPLQTINLGLDGQDMRAYLSFGNNMDKTFQPDLVFLMVNRADFRVLASHPKLLEKIANGLTEPITQPEETNPLAELVNNLGVRSFFGQIQAQTFGFTAMGHTSDPVVVDELRVEAVDPEVVAIQVNALQKIWGERLVVLYRAWPQNFGKGEPATYEDNILRELDRQNIPYINFYGPFKQAFDQRISPLGFNNSILGKGHLNQIGHQLVTDQILNYLASTNIVEVK